MSDYMKRWRGMRCLMCGLIVGGMILAGASDAWALKVYSHTDGDGFTTVDVYDDDGDLASTHIYGPDNEYIGSIYYDDDSTPNPGDENGSAGVSDDDIELMVEMIKKLGGTGLQVEEIWQILLVMGVLPEQVGITVIDPYEDVLGMDGLEGGFEGSGFDPNVPFDEQLPYNKGSSQDDSDDGENSSDWSDQRYQSDPSSYGEWYGLDPSIVNPIPVFVVR